MWTSVSSGLVEVGSVVSIHMDCVLSTEYIVKKGDLARLFLSKEYIVKKGDLGSKVSFQLRE